MSAQNTEKAAPSDAEIMQMWANVCRNIGHPIPPAVAFARALLARYGAQPAASAEPVAYRVLRRTHDGEWKDDGRDWCNGTPSADLKADIAQRADGWRIEYAYAAPVAAQAQPSGNTGELPASGERATFDQWFCRERGLPMDADTTQYDEAFLAYRAWQARASGQAPQHLLDRLRHHSNDITNTAFARSTMREALQYLESDTVATQAPAADADALEDYKENGAAAVRFAPSSAHWSNELRRLFGSDARDGIDRLEERLRAAEQDAARYRFIRSKVSASDATGCGTWVFHYDRLPHPLSNPLRGSVAEHFDAAIDAAMQRTSGGEQS